MTKQEFTSQLTAALQPHSPGKAGATASLVADQMEQHSAKGAAGAAAIDWGHWLQIIMTIIQTLGPILTPPSASKKK